MNTRNNRIQVSKTGTVAGAQPWINFIQGTGATLTVADNPTEGRIDVTIAASGGAGVGDVVGPGSAVDAQVALFDLTTGKLIKAATATGIAKLASGVLTAVTAPSGTIVGSTDTILLTNKTLQDSTTGIVDDGDVTKVLKFQCSGITTGTTRTLTIQDTTGTVYVTGGTDVAIADGGTALSTTPTNGQLLIGNGTNYTLASLTAGSNITITGGAGAITITGGAGSGGDCSTNTASSVDSEVALFSSTTGKLLKRASITGLGKFTSGVLSAATAGTDYYAPGSTDVAIADGGTALSTTPTNGQLLIGNGTNYTLASLTAGSNITITGGAGAITIAGAAGSGGDCSTNTASSVDSEVALFSSTTGKLLKRASITGLGKFTSGVLSAATAGTDYYAPGSTDVAIADGGTALSTTPTNGQLLIGNGTNYTLASLTAGSNITITGGAGAITIAGAAGGSGTQWVDDDGTTPATLPSAAGTGSFAIGLGASAAQTFSLAFGTKASASTAAQTIAIGSAASSGAGPTASALNSIAIGGASDTGAAIAMSGAGAIGIGSNASTVAGPSGTGAGAIIIGSKVGTGAGASQTSGSAIVPIVIGSSNNTGAGASVTGNGGIAIGGNRDTAAGPTAGGGSIAIGSAYGTSGRKGPTATGTATIVIGGSSGGDGQTASGTGAISIGTNHGSGAGGTHSGDGAIVMGGGGGSSSAMPTTGSGVASIAIGGFITGGRGATVSSVNNAIALGGNNGSVNGATVSGQGGIAIGGATSTGVGPQATAAGAVAIGGTDSSRNCPVASQSFAVAMGCRSIADVIGMRAYSHNNRSADGDTQSETYLFIHSTTNATPVEMTANGNAGGSSNRILLASGDALDIQCKLVGKSAAGNVLSKTINCSIVNVSGTTSLVGTNVVDSFATAGATSGLWDAAITADDTNDLVLLTLTGQAATTIQWVAEFNCVKVNI